MIKFIQLLSRTIFLGAFCLMPLKLKGQKKYFVNLDINNGLPSNNTYYSITDKFGYLWISTPKGVVRYNGYETRLFNLSDGLANEDVWELAEDNSGKIWLGNISEEMGYIQHGKYHSAKIIEGVGTMYPKGMKLYKNNLLFFSNYFAGKIRKTFCIEENDSIKTYALDDLKLIKNVKYDTEALTYCLGENGLIYLILKGNIYTAKLVDNKWQTKYQCPIKDYKMIANEISSLGFLCFNNYIVIYNIDSSHRYFCYINSATGTLNKVDLRKFGVDECFEHICQKNRGGDKEFYIITKSYVLTFSYKNALKYEEKFAIKDLLPTEKIDGSKVRIFNKKGFWGQYIGTTTNGLTVNYDLENNFIKDDKLNLINRKYVAGGIADSLSFWWNPSDNTLLQIDKNFRQTIFRGLDLKLCSNILPFNKDSFLIWGYTKVYFKNKPGSKFFRKKTENNYGNIFKVIRESKDTFYMVSTAGFSRIVTDGDTTYRYVFNTDRYNDLVYDSIRKFYWAYNYTKILSYKNGHTTVIPNKELKNFGVQKVQQIVFDNKYGNIFFKGADQITMYDLEKNKYTELFKNFNLTESAICVYHDLLIVSGPFGVIFSKITGRQKLSSPLLYTNLKNINYTYINYCQPFCGKLLLNTDKGAYVVNIPSDSALLNSSPSNNEYPCKYVLNYQDSTQNFVSGDTLTINQKNRRLQFDVINPHGNGNIKYVYQFPGDSAWRELNTNELTLPLSLLPDNYNRLALKVHDNVWQSDPIYLHIYIQPYWWQTNTGKRLTQLSTIFVIILLFSLSVLITRKLVLRAAKKRSMQMEMELKSIYAQINPHFIFNTLNAGLVLVSSNKMEEAYQHISKFSRLLRAYLKSSRNKLISVAEETVNLTDYIELQQERFKNKFEFCIEADHKIEQHKIKIPSLLIQPFVENAITHGILPKKEKGHLMIKFVQLTPGEIVCTIEDDGIGRALSRQLKEKEMHPKVSYGDLLINDLVNTFNRYESMNIHVKYFDKQLPDTGTIVTIHVKNLSNE